jgi:hypothetical protein
MSDVTGSSSFRTLLSEFSNLPTGIKRASTALLLLLAILLSAGVYGYFDLRQEIDQLADDLSFVESQLSMAEYSIDGLQDDVETLNENLNTLCRFFGVSYAC